MKLFSIYDKKAATFNAPFNAPTEVHAMRNFSMEVNRNDQGNTLNFAPNDFALYQVGEFNDRTGQVENSTPQLITEASALVRKENR